MSEVLHAVYLVNLTCYLVQNRDWVGKLLRIIGQSLRSYWDTGDRQYSMSWYLCTAHRFYPFLLFGKTAGQWTFFMRQKRNMWHHGQESTETIRNRRRTLGHVWRSLSRRVCIDYEQFLHFFLCVRRSLPHRRTTVVSWLASLRVTSAAFDSCEIMMSIYLLGNRDRRVMLIV